MEPYHVQHGGLSHHELHSLFMEYFNDWLTVKNFASFYGISEKRASFLLSLGKHIHNKRAYKLQNDKTRRWKLFEFWKTGNRTGKVLAIGEHHAAILVNNRDPVHYTGRMVQYVTNNHHTIKIFNRE